MGVFKRFWRRLSGMVVCLIALVLPFGPRMLFARLLSCSSRPPKASASPLLRGPLKLWNRVLMGVVFFLGLPMARLFFVFTGGSRKLAPKPGRDTYWIRRPAPEEFDKGIGDQF